MSTVKAILVDDENHGRVLLKELLAKYCNEVEVIAEADNADEAYTLIQKQHPDVIFLDIEMPGGDGFSLLKRFEQINFDVVFVTSYHEYAVTAFKFSALDYILKPIDINDLKSAVEKVYRHVAEKNHTGKWVVNLLNNLEENGANKKLVLHRGDKVHLLNVGDVICLEAESNYTNVYASDGQKFTPARVLKDFEIFLAPNPNFIRINKSVIVNMDCVTGYSKGEPCMLYLNNGKEYEISRRKKAELNERIKP